MVRRIGLWRTSLELTTGGPTKNGGERMAMQAWLHGRSSVWLPGCAYESECNWDTMGYLNLPRRAFPGKVTQHAVCYIVCHMTRCHPLAHVRCLGHAAQT